MRAQEVLAAVPLPQGGVGASIEVLGVGEPITHQHVVQDVAAVLRGRRQLVLKQFAFKDVRRLSEELLGDWFVSELWAQM